MRTNFAINNSFQKTSNSKYYLSALSCQPDSKPRADRSGMKSGARKHESSTVDGLVAQFRRSRREKVHYTTAWPCSSVVSFSARFPGRLLGGRGRLSFCHLFIPSCSRAAPSFFHPPPSFPRGRNAVCINEHAPPPASYYPHPRGAIGTPGLSATLPAAGRRYFTRCFLPPFSYVSPLVFDARPLFCTSRFA